MEKNDISAIKHIAFIMDGNGRWAQAKGMPREFGHNEGAKKFKEIAGYCGNIGIKYITVYAFSTENWKRPKKEVDALMNIFRLLISDAKRTYKRNKTHFVFLGNKNALDEAMRTSMEEVERLSSCYEKTVSIAINYGGRAEIVDAVNKLTAEGMTDITEDDITKNIYSGFCPPPDMIVRTGGEKRLSNFLLWQSSYAELFFTDTLWPDFSKAELVGMIEEYFKRTRRFGGV